MQQGGCAARGRLPPLERMPLEEAPAERDRHEGWRGGGEAGRRSGDGDDDDEGMREI